VGVRKATRLKQGAKRAAGGFEGLREVTEGLVSHELPVWTDGEDDGERKLHFMAENVSAGHAGDAPSRFWPIVIVS
jgi:hypothetical protein